LCCVVFAASSLHQHRLATEQTELRDVELRSASHPDLSQLVTDDLIRTNGAVMIDVDAPPRHTSRPS
jgi:hypothetical protein